MKNALFLPLILALSGCFYAGMDDPYSRIDPALQPYFDSFRYEAEIRGVELDYSQVKLQFGPTHDGANGTTYYQHSRITIDSNSMEWKERPEMLVFHELGHLMLGRGHIDQIIYEPHDGGLNIEVAKSIMSLCGTRSFEAEHHKYRRKYFVDELFNSSTPRPEWAI